MKKSWIIGLAIVLAITLMAPDKGFSARKDVTWLSLATSSIGGTWQILGAGIAVMVNRECKNIKMTPEATGGGTDNLRLLGTGQSEFGLATSDGTYNAVRGLAEFKDKKYPLKGVFGGNQFTVQFYTLASSPIKSLADFRGKKISIGDKGSVGNFITKIAMEEYGMEMGKDWRPEFLGHQAGADALRDNNVDAVVYVGPLKPPAVLDATTTHSIRFLSLDKDKLDSFLKKYPFYSPSSIPAKTYRGLDQEVPNLFGPVAILLAREDVDAEVVYCVSKAILGNEKDFQKVHPHANEWVLKNAERGIKGVVDFHPGALKYLKEKGAVK